MNSSGASKSAIVVLGSLNIDFVVRTNQLPAPGQTVLGHQFETIPGGKGANQAVAAARLSRGDLAVRMIGRVGLDSFGDRLKATLAAAGVDVRAVAAVRTEPTGVAMIGVDASGQNAIIVARGANATIRDPDVPAFRNSYRGCTYALFQLETPVEAVEAAMILARSEKAKTILDPAPAQPLSSALLRAVDILTPNETEACMLAGRIPATLPVHEALEIGRMLLQSGPAAVVVKLGAAGCVYVDPHCSMRVQGYDVEACDTTAAGDTFNGALAVALSEGFAMGEALSFANAAAALSVTRPGAQTSMPLRSQVDAFLTSYTAHDRFS